jgi:ribulose kinase
MVAIMGISTCHVMNATELHEVPGMSSCGVRVTWVISTKVLGWVAAGGGGPVFDSSASFLVWPRRAWG